MKKPATRFDPRAFLARVGDGKTVETYRANAVIYRQGGPADRVFYLQSGKVKETVTSEQGKEAVVGMIEPGQFFGTSGLDGGQARLSTAIAVTPCAVTAITKQAMKEALQTRPAFNQMFMAYLLEHNSRVEAEKVDLLFNSVERRLARKLLILSGVNTDGTAPQAIGPEITQETLATMIGTTRPHVNMFLRRFAKMGFITKDRRRGITVRSSLLNLVLHEGNERAK